MYQSQPISTHTEQVCTLGKIEGRLATTMKQKNHDDRAARWRRRKREGHRDATGDSVGVGHDRRASSTITPWLQIRRHKPLTAAYVASAVSAKELASVCVLNVQSTRGCGPHLFKWSNVLIYWEHSLWRSSSRPCAGELE